MPPNIFFAFPILIPIFPQIYIDWISKYWLLPIIFFQICWLDFQVVLPQIIFQFFPKYILIGSLTLPGWLVGRAGSELGRPTSVVNEWILPTDPSHVGDIYFANTLYILSSSRGFRHWCQEPPSPVVQRRFASSALLSWPRVLDVAELAPRSRRCWAGLRPPS